jgi:hypothetical protein
MSNSTRKAYSHKKTMFCPQKGCNYTSRHWLAPNVRANKTSNSSTICPVHRKPLIAELEKTRQPD